MNQLLSNFSKKSMYILQQPSVNLSTYNLHVLTLESTKCLNLRLSVQQAQLITLIFNDSQFCFYKVEKILKGGLDLIPSPSMKIQIMGGKVCLRCKAKTLLGIVNKLLKTKGLLTSPSNVLSYYLE